MEKPLCLIAYAKSLRKNNLAWFISAFACGFARLRAPAKHRRNAFAAKVGTALLTKSLHPKKKVAQMYTLRWAPDIRRDSHSPLPNRPNWAKVRYDFARVLSFVVSGSLGESCDLPLASCCASGMGCSAFGSTFGAGGSCVARQLFGNYGVELVDIDL